MLQHQQQKDIRERLYKFKRRIQETFVYIKHNICNNNTIMRQSTTIMESSSSWVMVITTLIIITIIMILRMPVVDAENTSMFLYKDDKKANIYVKEVTLMDGFFQSSIKPRVVEFYSPYCGHCISFKPSYVQVAKDIQKKYKDNEIEFYGVSCAGMAELCQKYNIQSYPSVYAIEEGIHANSTDDMKSVGVLLFSTKSVEKALQLKKKNKLLRTTSDTTRRLDNSDNEDEIDEEEVEDEVEEEEEEEEPDEEEEEEEVETNDDDDNKEAVASDDDENVGDDEEEKLDADDDENLDVDDKDEDSVDEDEFTSWQEHGVEVPIPEHRPVGADVAREQQKAMDKWKDIQKQRLREKEFLWMRQSRQKPKHIGAELLMDANNNVATKTMKANRKGTTEYNDKQKEFLKVIERMHNTKRKKRDEWSQKVKNGETPFKKQISKPTMGEKIPIIKHIVKLSTEEELILDVSLSFIEGLRVGVYKSPEPLTKEKKSTLYNWLHLLSISLPQEWALQTIINDLLIDINTISNSPKQFMDIVNKHNFPRNQWSKSCIKTQGGLTCGFWKLLHVMTIGIAEQRGGIDLINSGTIRSDATIFSPLHAADIVRDYMYYFFPCTSCSKHFIDTYDNCNNNRRCDRLHDDADDATDADWKELALWLWEVHNDVNVRLLNERADVERKYKQSRKKEKYVESGPGAATMEDEVKALYPTIDDCIICFNTDGTYNENEIFLFLEKTYWPGYDLKDTPRRLIWFEDDGEGAIGLNMIIFTIALLIICYLRNRISRASFANTVLRAKTRIANGGKKIRTF